MAPLRSLGRSNASLVAGLRAGSPAAAAGLLDRHGALAWAFARHLTGAPEPAQAALEAAWARLPRAPGTLPDSLLEALWAATQETLASERSTLRWDTAAAGPEPGELEAGLAALEDDERAAVLLEALRDRPPAADARVLGRTGAAELVGLRTRGHVALAGLAPATDVAQQAAREALVARAERRAKPARTASGEAAAMAPPRTVADAPPDPAVAPPQHGAGGQPDAAVAPPQSGADTPLDPAVAPPQSGADASLDPAVAPPQSAPTRRWTPLSLRRRASPTTGPTPAVAPPQSGAGGQPDPAVAPPRTDAGLRPPR